MRALVQRVNWAEVEVDRRIVGQIGRGLLVYVGVAPTDTLALAAAMAERLANLRIFNDEAGKLNLSVQDVRGGILAVSNFTLLADARKGRRPAFVGAAPAAMAAPLHEALLAELGRHGLPLAAGVFGADMTIRSAADGPVNIVIDLE